MYVLFLVGLISFGVAYAVQEMRGHGKDLCRLVSWLAHTHACHEGQRTMHAVVKAGSVCMHVCISVTDILSRSWLPNADARNSEVLTTLCSRAALRAQVPGGLQDDKSKLEREAFMIGYEPVFRDFTAKGTNYILVILLRMMGTSLVSHDLWHMRV